MAMIDDLAASFTPIHNQYYSDNYIVYIYKQLL